jgi:hypothetical protein
MTTTHQSVPIRFLLAACLLIGSAETACAQSDPPGKPKKEMNVDMPDETEETDLVDPGQLQLETAVLINRYRNGATSVIGQGLLRYGLSRRVELRAIAEDGRQRDRYLENTVQATEPLALGGKVVLLKDRGAFPDITFVGYLKLPLTARSRSQNAYWSPIVLLAFQHKLAGEKIKLEYNAGAQQEPFGATWSWLGNASVHYRLTQSLEAFGEYYAQYSRAESPMHNLGGGLALEVGEQVEIYVSGGSTIDNPDRNYFFASGLALRTR